MLVGALLFIEIIAFASVVPLLARLPIRRLQRVVEAASGEHSRVCWLLDRAGEARIVRSIEIVCRMGRRFIRRRCMTRGLTLYFFLRRAGVDVSLVFGAGEIGANFEGHCWLERDGAPFLEATDPRPYFTRMYAFGGVVRPSANEAVDVFQA